MSTLESKLTAPPRPSGTAAQATYHQLAARSGFRPVDERRVEIHSMGTVALWVRIQGTGQQALFEKQETNSDSPEGGPNRETDVDESVDRHS